MAYVTKASSASTFEPMSEEIDLEQPRCNRAQSLAASSMASLKTTGVQAMLEEHIREHFDLLAKVTGEEGDISRDPMFAHGQSSLTFRDVSFSIKLADGSSKQILAPTSGHFEPGSLVALMGPSGCGKTTLLDILAGKKTAAYEGTVHVNGRPRDQLWSRISSYVPQEDIMPPAWTVKEAVLFNHQLKNPLPRKVKEDTRSQLVDMLLADLGLDHVKDSQIGDATVRGISGGQRRRVTLARGFANRAQIMFADEPTSGLSATDAEACVKLMRLMAKKFGITIIVVIHQPRIEVANLFDHLMLFTSNPGRCVYNGSMKGAIAHWEAVGYPVSRFANPTDHFLDTVTPGTLTDHTDEFVQYFNDHQRPIVESLVTANIEKKGSSAIEILEQLRETEKRRLGSIPPVRNSKYALGFAQQLKYVFRRKLALNFRDKKGVITEYVMALFKALIMGVGFMNIGSEPAQLQLGFIYMLLLSVAMSGMQKMPQLVDERTVMKMETSDALYTELAYIITVAVINTICSVGANTLFVTVMFLFSGMSFELFGPMILWASLAFVCFDSLFAFIAAIAKDSQSAQATALPFLLLFVIYNGFSITKAACPAFMQWAIRISPAAYAIEAMAITCENLSTGVIKEQWSQVNELYEYEDNRGIAVAVFIGLVIVCRLGQFVCLQHLNKIQR